MTNKREIVDYFLQNPTSTIIDISNHTGFSKSTVQRFLNSQDISLIYGSEVASKIKKQLETNQNNGRKKGGTKSYQNNQPIKDDNGKFIGTEKRNQPLNYEPIKENDISVIGHYFSLYPNKTLSELEDDFNGLYTRDYIYDCLNDSRVEEILGPVFASAIRKQLEINSYSALANIINIPDFCLDDYPLTDVEKQIIMMRFFGEQIRTQQEIANTLKISRQMVSKIERRVYLKIQNDLPNKHHHTH